MKRNTQIRYWLAIMTITMFTAGLSRAAEPCNKTAIKFQSLKFASINPKFDLDRMNTIGQALDFQNWPKSENLWVAPKIDKKMFPKSELVTKELKSISLVDFEGGPCPRGVWTWRRVIENTKLPTELPLDYKNELLEKLPAKLRNDPNQVDKYLKKELAKYRDTNKFLFEGDLTLYVCTAPGSLAAREYMLYDLTTFNNMPPEPLAVIYNSGKKTDGVGNISVTVKEGDDTQIWFVRDNIFVTIHATKCLIDSASAFAQAIDSSILQQKTLTADQLVSRRPVVSFAEKLTKDPNSDGKFLDFTVSVPPQSNIREIKLIKNTNSIPAEIKRDKNNPQNGRLFIDKKNLSGKPTAAVKIVVITDELMAVTAEKQIDPNEK